jgi:hypothetical protein
MACATKEKPHRSCPKTFGTDYDAARPGWAGIRRRAIWNTVKSFRFLVRSASYSSLTRNARQLPQPATPGETLRNRFLQKNPSAATPRREGVSEISCKHRLPQARCLFGPLFIRLPVAAEGRLKLLRQFNLCLAIGYPCVNLLNPLFLQYVVQNPTRGRWDGPRGVCVAMTQSM